MKEDRVLHIIAFNVPAPPDYGGVIDIFYKIKALHESGIRVILHTYQYGREQSSELNNICEAVYYYKRDKTLEYFFRRQAFIVVTRNSRELIDRLQKDRYPIIFEGLHCCNNIDELDHNDRKLVIRAHNIEHEYYSQLGFYEKNFLKKIFYYTEAMKLTVYEKEIYPSRQIAAISSSDDKYFAKNYSNSSLIPAFHPYEDIEIKQGFGSHILYHGNLSVPENIEAANFLLKNVFPYILYPCIIAGKNPHKSIYKNAQGVSNVKILDNPDKILMEELISNAQINLLPAFQKSGLKLKLLAALFRGRHCLVNAKMISGSGLESLCTLAEEVSEFIARSNELILKPLEDTEIIKRKELLFFHFSNKLNAAKLIQLLWPE